MWVALSWRDWKNKIDCDVRPYGDGLTILQSGFELPFLHGIDRGLIQRGIERVKKFDRPYRAIGSDQDLQYNETFESGFQSRLFIRRRGPENFLWNRNTFIALRKNFSARWKSRIPEI